MVLGFLRIVKFVTYAERIHGRTYEECGSCRGSRESRTVSDQTDTHVNVLQFSYQLFIKLNITIEIEWSTTQRGKPMLFSTDICMCSANDLLMLIITLM